MQTTRPTPPAVPGNAARRILAGALGALRGDKYMVGAYPPAKEPDSASAQPPSLRPEER